MNDRHLLLILPLVVSVASACGNSDDHGLFDQSPGAPDASYPDDAKVTPPDGAAGQGGGPSDDAAVVPDSTTGQETSTGPDGAADDVAQPQDGGCQDGETKESSCGLNGRGTQTDLCLNGMWTTGTCVDPDVCVDGDTQQVPCGPGGKGKLIQDCIDGHWKDAAPCEMPPPKDGRWECVAGACQPVFGDPDCGDGVCSPADGESPGSCPPDCAALASQSGENQPCEDEIDCAFYAWPGGGNGYWACSSSIGQGHCSAVKTNSYCGTNGFAYCYYGSAGIETPGSCPKDCANKLLNQGSHNGCESAAECIFLTWPASP